MPPEYGANQTIADFPEDLRAWPLADPLLSARSATMITDLSGVERAGIGGETRPAIRTLDEFEADPGCSDGIAIASLEPGVALLVHTQNTCYRIVILDGRKLRALVTSGRLFPDPTEVRIEGATTGGSLLKVGWLGIGLRLELSMGHRRIVTSRIRSVAVERLPIPLRAS